MRVAVPFENGRIFQHFGKTAAFLIAGNWAICVGRGGAETGTVTVQAGSGSGTGVVPIYFSWSGNTVDYHTGNEYSQMNVSGAVYWVLALIPMD